MPKIYRVMEEENGKLIMGNKFGMLGARVPTDITPDTKGDVHSGMFGMSVNPNISDIPSRLLPKRLQDEYRNARGSNTSAVWSHGEGPFIQAP
jgi:hypothetical protein